MGADPVAECIWPLEATLGEGPVWHDASASLWFVDIKGQRVHRYTPGGGAASGRRATWEAPDQVSFLAPRTDGRFVAGLKRGLHLFDPADGSFQLLQVVEPPQLDNRTNDAHVDHLGRVWFGTMHDGESATSGALYCLDAGTVHRRDSGYCITNGPATSPDGRTLYHVDTLQGLVYAFDLAPDGRLSGRREFVRIAAAAGWPDGLSVDSAGRVWVGLWGGWGAQSFTPGGKPDVFVRLPCANVTKVVFGGPDLCTMYFTSARKGLAPEALATQPLAGGLFAARSDVPGLPSRLAQAVPAAAQDA
jgi:sugar lactone lactonase YvrE